MSLGSRCRGPSASLVLQEEPHPPACGFHLVFLLCSPPQHSTITREDPLSPAVTGAAAMPGGSPVLILKPEVARGTEKQKPYHLQGAMLRAEGPGRGHVAGGQ